MSVFAILSDRPQPELQAAVEKAYPDSHYHWSDTVSFVRTSGPALTIALKIGVRRSNPEGEPTGKFTGVVVTQLSSSYFGWSKNTLWEWLKTAFEAVD